MEVAGLALGIYPAAVLAFEQFKVGQKYFNNWVKFRRKYEELIRDIEAQQLTFHELLFNLMCCGPDPYLKWVDNDKNAFLEIVGDTSYSGWSDPKLKMNLEMRLGDKYSWFVFTIDRINKLLGELEALLSIENFATSERTPDWWRYQWERVKKTLFAEKNEEKWKEAKRLNDDLLKMLELSDKHQAIRTTTSTSIAKFFKIVQGNALGLHKVLERAWHCQCDTAHKVLLMLERRLQNRESQFCLVFFLPQQPPSVINSNEAHFASQVSQVQFQETPKAVEREVQIKKLHDVTRENSLVSSVDLDTLSSADNSMSGALSPSSSTSDICTKQSSHNGKPADKLPKKWSFKHMISGKFLKVEKLSAVASLNSQDQEKPNVSSSTSLKVTFTQISPSRESAVDVPVPIPELCTTIQSGSTLVASGYLQDEKQMQYHLSSPNSNGTTERHMSTVTLKELLAGHHRTFPRQKRLLVAANLASSFIQLHRTSWLNAGWGKESILFDKHGQKVMFEKPYLATQFLSTPPDHQSVSGESRLLEERPEYLMKTSLQSLGIVLIELCFGEHIEKSSHKVQLRPNGDQPNRDFCLAIANAWTEEEILYEDPPFASPIDNCLRFPDIGRIRKGRYDEVLEDLYLSVAKPLQDEVVRQQMIMGTGSAGVSG